MAHPVKPMLSANGGFFWDKAAYLTKPRQLCKPGCTADKTMKIQEQLSLTHLRGMVPATK